MDTLLYKDEVYQIVGSAFEVYNELGPGFLEAVYQKALKIEFELRKIPYEEQKLLEIFFKGYKLDKQYQADFVCFENIVVEIKAVDDFHSAYDAQIKNYLKATKTKLGILINFGSFQKLQWKRIVF